MCFSLVLPLISSDSDLSAGGEVKGFEKVEGPSFGNQYWIIERGAGHWGKTLFDNQYTVRSLKTGGYLDLDG